jgi:hypothetical protein
LLLISIMFHSITTRRLRRSTRVNTNAIVINRVGMTFGGGNSSDDDSGSDSGSESGAGARERMMRTVQEQLRKRKRNYRGASYARNSFRAGAVDMLMVQPNMLQQQQQQQSTQNIISAANTAALAAQYQQQQLLQQQQNEALLQQQIRLMQTGPSTRGSYGSTIPAPPAGPVRTAVPFSSPMSARGGGDRIERLVARANRPPTEEEKEILQKLEVTAGLKTLPPSSSPPKKHRGFGASANKFNQDGSLDLGEFRMKWRCSWCLLGGKFTPVLRRGPMGSKVR